MGENGTVHLILLIILAVLLPPVAVILEKGCSWEFWLSLLLTILAFVPGVIFSIYVVVAEELG